jgi:hypothetical protein
MTTEYRPVPRDAYAEALREAWDEIVTRDIASLARSAGASSADLARRVFVISVTGTDCEVDFGQRSMHYLSPERKPLRTEMQVLVLHYMLGSHKGDVTGRMVTFREFEGGAVYFPAFKKRTLELLTGTFGNSPALLSKAGQMMSGEPLDTGSSSVRVWFFPKVPVDVIVWQGDDEVPASANMLFDEGTGKMLPTEDISWLATALCYRLIALSRA